VPSIVLAPNCVSRFSSYEYLVSTTTNLLLYKYSIYSSYTGSLNSAIPANHALIPAYRSNCCSILSAPALCPSVSFHCTNLLILLSSFHFSSISSYANKLLNVSFTSFKISRIISSFFIYLTTFLALYAAHWCPFTRDPLAPSEWRFCILEFFLGLCPSTPVTDLFRPIFFSPRRCRGLFR